MLISIRLWCFSLKLDKHNTFSKKQLSEMPHVSVEQAHIVSRPADARKVEPKKQFVLVHRCYFGYLQAFYDLHYYGSLEGYIVR